MSQNRIDTTALNQINRALIGFDQIFNNFEGRFANQISNNYPPFNIVQYGENDYELQIAVAGFKKEEIDITVDQNVLIVEGKKQERDLPEGAVFHHRGLAARDFFRDWTLVEYTEVRGAEIQDGILTIKLERVIPDALKPRKIAIASTIETDQPKIKVA
jgi:molecular chaperone IbpA